MKKLLHNLLPFFGLFLFIVALWALHHALREYHYHDIVRSIREIPAHRFWGAALLTALNYGVMTGYDSLAFRYIGRSLAYGKIALASFIGYAFSNNVGLAMLAGSSVRYRLYSAWGLSGLEISQVVAFYTVTLWLGLFFMSGAIFLFEPAAIPGLLSLPFSTVRPLGMTFLAVVCGYLAWIVLTRKPFSILGWNIPLPSFGLSLAQIAVSSLDWAMAGSVLYVLLPLSMPLSYPGFLGIFLLAQVAGLVSQVPGGLGVFETVVLLSLSPVMPSSLVLASLLLYRVIYYLLPLGIAAVMLGTYEVFLSKERVKRFVFIFGQWVPEVAPRVLSFTSFAAGAILLFSGATPAVPSRLLWLKDLLPFPVMEFSHFFGSLVGAGLLLLARGLYLRLDAAYHLTALLLGAGMAFSLLKGFDYEEAVILAIMLGSLLASHRYFYRQSALLAERFSFGWMSAVILVLLGTVWLGLFSYKHVEYSHDLWWRFAFDGDAPRFLRAMAGAISIVLVFSAARLLRPAQPEPAPPGAMELERARAVISRSKDTYPNLALLGDKEILFSPSGNAFIMYGVEGRSWVSMGDPVGPEEERKELAWRFWEICDRHGGWTVFYEVRKENLPLYLDLGLTLLKLGEEARVSLATFTLEGSSRKGLRYLHHRVEREGFVFTVVPAPEVSGLLPELKAVSDAWLAQKHTREKMFSLGFFQEEYLKQFPIGIVRKEGTIIAFANIWPGAEREELSIDLMRHIPGAPNGIMEYLFVELMLWGKSEGYQWFNLGMAPFSGLEDRTLTPLWSRLGAMVYRHGEHFYNFQGLRQFKERFGPVWEPKHLASPGGLKLPRIIANLASLISGGLKGAIAR